MFLLKECKECAFALRSSKTKESISPLFAFYYLPTSRFCRIFALENYYLANIFP